MPLQQRPALLGDQVEQRVERLDELLDPLFFQRVIHIRKVDPSAGEGIHHALCTRAVFVMREVEGMSTAESAECLDITEETAKTRLHRARKLLRDTLYERAGIESGAAFSFEAPRCDRVVAAVFEQIEAVDQPSLPRPN